MKFTKHDLTPSPAMHSRVYGGINRLSTASYTDGDGLPIEGVVKAGDVDRLSPETFRRVQFLYSAALQNFYLAGIELPREIQTKIFQTGRVVEHDGTLDVLVERGTFAAPYSHAMIDALEIDAHPPTVGDLRAKPYDGSNVLLSGGVNNFVLSDMGAGDYGISLLTLQRNAISNDGVTPLADALKLQSPGGGRVESVVTYPELGATETKEEVLTNPALRMGKALIRYPWLNPVRVRGFLGRDFVSEFPAHPFIDKDNNTLEAYQNALHPTNVEMAEDQHAPDALMLDNGQKLYRARNAGLTSLEDLVAFAQSTTPELEFVGDESGQSSGVVRAAVLDYLRVTRDQNGDYAAEPTGVTPQIGNLVDSGLVGKLIDLQHAINHTRVGANWAKQVTADYRA